MPINLLIELNLIGWRCSGAHHYHRCCGRRCAKVQEGLQPVLDESLHILLT